MRSRIIVAVSVICALAAVVSGCAAGRSGLQGRKTEKGYDVYLLIGQSNMAGRGTMLPEDTQNPLEGVFLLDGNDKPVPATNPLNQYSTVRKNIGMQQICPGNGFSSKMYDHNGRRILLVVNARGGTGLDEWVEGTEKYNEAVRRTRLAMEYGTLKGILWHQGCADASAGKTSTYLARLAPMVNALRRDLGVDESVPFVAGELCRWIAGFDKFNEMLHNISLVIPNSACVSSEGCGPLKPESLSTGKPDPHFSREGQLILGARYADKMIEMLK